MQEAEPGPADDTASHPPAAPPAYEPTHHVPPYDRPDILADDRPGQRAPGGERDAAEAGEQSWQGELAVPPTDAGAAPALTAPASGMPSGAPGLPYPMGGVPAPSAVPRPPLPPSIPPPPREAWLRPRRIDAVPGTGFGVVHLDVPPITSGLAVGGLVAGIGSILVALLVACFGVAGANGGWGGWAAGAFAILGALLGGAGLVLGLVALRQIRLSRSRPGIRFAGRGLAVAGISCGAAGMLLTVLAFLLALTL